MKYNLTNKQKAFLYIIKRCGLYTTWAKHRKKYFCTLKGICKDNNALDFINRKKTIKQVIAASFCWGDTCYPVAFWCELSNNSSCLYLEDLLSNKELLDDAVNNFKKIIKDFNDGKF